jgi:hypothetical protein
MSHKKYRTETNCLNCGAQVQGKFCSECGQANIETRENIFHLVGHFIADYLHYDSKFFRSLSSLFIRPGFLTKQYWEGKRVRYIHPLRLFFFMTIFFMLASTYFYNRFGDRLQQNMITPDPLMAKYDSTFLATHPDTLKVYEKAWGDTAITVRELKELSVTHDRRMRKVAQGFDNFFSNIKYVTFFLLPVYALIFKLMYIRRKTFYVDQLVYSMHLQSFAYCLLCLTLMLPFLFEIDLRRVNQITFLIMLIYVGFSLHYLYRQAIWKTLLKTFISTFLLFMVTASTLIMFAFIDAIFFEK